MYEVSSTLIEEAFNNDPDYLRALNEVNLNVSDQLDLIADLLGLSNIHQYKFGHYNDEHNR